MAIDRMDWHSDSALEQGLNEESAATHIGMYLAWIIEHELVGEFHLEESAAALQQLKDRQISGRDFLIELCDEKFWEEDLNPEGLAFTQAYYENDADYFNDYIEVLAQDLPSLYHVENSWDNYERIAQRINQRYQDWKLKV